MKIVAGLLVLLFLVGCGVDGAPEAPGISVSGEARIGLSGSL